MVEAIIISVIPMMIIDMYGVIPYVD